MKVSIIGGGSFGTAIAQLLSDNKHNVLIRDINEEFVLKINNDHRHPFFDVSIPTDIKATTDLKKTIAFSDTIILCVPTSAMRTVIKEIATIITEPKIFVNVSKGIEPESSKLVSEILDEEIDSKYIRGFVVVSGPSFADEIMKRKVTTLVAASLNIVDAELIQDLFTNDQYMRVYTSSDVIGVEVCGAIKNAIALASGISEGLNLGMNARAGLLTRGIREIVKIVKVMGGAEATCFGLAGMGDLLLTASSTQSRNFQAGLRLGHGETLENILATSRNVVEGVRAINAAHEIAKKYNLELPIIETVYKVLYEGLNVDLVVNTLLNRELKQE